MNKRWLSLALAIIITVSPLSAMSVQAQSADGYVAEGVEGRRTAAGTAITPNVKNMTNGWHYIRNAWYYVRDGKAVTGWLKVNGKQYFLDSTGAMRTGWLKIGGKLYYFGRDGALSTSSSSLNTDKMKAKTGGSTSKNSEKTVKSADTSKSTAKTTKKKTKKTKGEQVVDYALKFVGNPYVYGGCSLTKGTDCSGFVMLIYRHFGVSLPHYDAAIRSHGKAVPSLKEAKAGDIICYYGHVAIYIGDGRIVHAANSRDGIKISDRADYRTIACIRRIFD